MSKRKEETTQELLGIKELLEYGVRTYRKEELAYFLIQPTTCLCCPRKVCRQESMD